MTPHYSLIIPVYAASDSITCCLESVMTNPIPSRYEVLVVDDGSLDDSGSILESFCLHLSSVMTIHQRNGRSSAARNMGMDLTNAEFICFLDSDDCVTPDYFATLDREKLEEWDLLIFEYYYGSGNWYTRMAHQYDFDSLRPFEDFVKAGLLGGSVIKIYRNSIIQQYHVRFDTGVQHSEDCVFMCEYLEHTQNIKKIDSASAYIYIYNRNPLSITHSYYAQIYKQSVRLMLAREHMLSMKESHASPDFNNLARLEDFYYCALYYCTRSPKDKLLSDINNLLAAFQPYLDPTLPAFTMYREYMASLDAVGFVRAYRKRNLIKILEFTARKIATQAIRNPRVAKMLGFQKK
ncbi:hypothetical protein AGMMS49992_16270 [Clostridia bacterium]|nr:hypothetical protein AGMMS49992_16270 [Clostridia bacterium]